MILPTYFYYYFYFSVVLSHSFIRKIYYPLVYTMCQKVMPSTRRAFYSLPPVPPFIYQYIFCMYYTYRYGKKWLPNENVRFINIIIIIIIIVVVVVVVIFIIDILIHQRYSSFSVIQFRGVRIFMGLLRFKFDSLSSFYSSDNIM